MKALWQKGWRIGLCAALLLWIFHSIFVNEARNAHQDTWQELSRLEQWNLGWKEGPGGLWGALTVIRPDALVLSLILMGVTIILGVFRWTIILRAQGLNLSLGRAAEISLVAHFFNSFLLGSTGGDVMKAYYAARETDHHKTEAVTTVFADRLIGLWAMLVFAGVMMWPNRSWLFTSRISGLASLLVLGMLIACSVLGVLAFRGGVSKKWAGARAWLRRLPKGEWLERSLESCRRFGREPFLLTRTFALSMLVNVVCVAQWFVLGHGLGLEIPPLALAAVVPIVISIAALPVTPSGLGVRENLFLHMLSALFLHMLSAPPDTATLTLSLALLAYAGSLFWSVIGGGVYMFLKDKHRLSKAELQGKDPA